MRRRPAARRTRYAALALELAGALGIVGVIAVFWSLAWALVLACVLAVLAAQFVEDLL